MATGISGQVSGGPRTNIDGCETVADARAKLGLDKTYRATVNGEPQDDDYELQDFELVQFAPAVKGGK